MNCCAFCQPRNWNQGKATVALSSEFGLADSGLEASSLLAEPAISVQGFPVPLNLVPFFSVAARPAHREQSAARSG